MRPLDPHSFVGDGFDGPVLIAGDVGDVPMIRRLLAAMPPGVFGQVYVEAFARIQYLDLRGPDGVSVQWLYRDVRQSSTRKGAGAAKGEPLLTAVHAWLDEWLLADEDGEYRIWIGARTIPRVNHLCAALQSHLEHREQHIAWRAEQRERERVDDSRHGHLDGQH
jgi:NADPH-dependent ferric siderophore reductase